MDKFAKITDRQYHLFDYIGHPQAERIVVIMGSGGETAETTVKYLIEKGEKVGVVCVRLYRPFSVDIHRLVTQDRQIDSSAGPHQGTRFDRRAALYRHSERAGRRQAAGHPCDRRTLRPVIQGIHAGHAESRARRVEEARTQEPLYGGHQRRRFTHQPSNSSPSFSVEPVETVRCMFFGLGSDGTVGANKNSIKIIGEETDNFAQGYFVYDSKKSGTVTISHLRFGPKPIHAPYLIETNQANFCGLSPIQLP